MHFIIWTDNYEKYDTELTLSEHYSKLILRIKWFNAMQLR